ncbi:MAG: ATP-grasp domain-containing protein [Acidobacteria bacterium]|nr:ATP-grasp domain-containing protein [Acidobacteriota bacterium]
MSAPFYVFVHEYFCGGGARCGDPPGGLAAEALGMLWALLADFRAWGGVRTAAALDPRFEERIPGLNRNTLPADEVVRVPPGKYDAVFLDLVSRCDAALVIAPETGGILSGLSGRVESAGKLLLGSGASAAAVAGDKESCDRIFRAAGLPALETSVSGFDCAERAAREIGFPLVVKPPDGVGSEGVCLAGSGSDIPAALACARRVASRDAVLLQPYVSGIHASVSLLVGGGRCLPLSLNRQRIRPGIPFEYRGVEVPFGHPRIRDAFDLARSAARLIPGLNGYVGVDLILADDSVRLVEINPRLTTSYIGLRQVAGINPARMIFEACARQSLPQRVPLEGRVAVVKDDPGSWGLKPSG